MSGRFALLVLIPVALAGGCATVSEERLSLLESAVLDMQAQEMRLASLEETVAGLVAQGKTAGSRTGEAQAAAVPEDARASSGPRRVYAEPDSAHPTAAPSTHAAPAKSNALAARTYQTALSTLESGRPQAALGEFQGFLANWPGHALAPNAGYWLGECYYSMKRYDAAVTAFKDVVAQYPAHEKAAAAMLKAGYSYLLLEDTANARFYLEALIRDYPATQPASLARARLASL